MTLAKRDGASMGLPRVPRSQFLITKAVTIDITLGISDNNRYKTGHLTLNTVDAVHFWLQR